MMKTAAGSSETFFSLLIIGDFMGTRDDLHAQQMVLLLSWTDKVAQVNGTCPSVGVLFAANACSSGTSVQLPPSCLSTCSHFTCGASPSSSRLASLASSLESSSTHSMGKDPTCSMHDDAVVLRVITFFVQCAGKSLEHDALPRKPKLP